MYPFTFPSMAGSPFMMGSYSAPQDLFQAPMMSAPQQQPSMNYSQAMGGPQVQSILEALNQVRNRQMAGAGGGAPGGPTTGPMPSNMAGRLGAMTNPTGLPGNAAPARSRGPTGSNPWSYLTGQFLGAALPDGWRVANGGSGMGIPTGGPWRGGFFDPTWGQGG